MKALVVAIMLVVYFGTSKSYGMGYLFPSYKKSGTIIQGYITDVQTKQPIAGAKVKIASLLGKTKAVSFTDERGYYRFSFGRMESIYVLSFKKQGYVFKWTIRLFCSYRTYTISYGLAAEQGSVTDKPSPVSDVVTVSKERIYIYLNGQRIAMEETINGVSRKYFFHNDHLGSTNVVSDEAGNPVKYMEYEAFGETKVDQGSLSVNKKFTGKELDDSTGLYDYGARQYDARIRRFISADTAEPDLTNPQSLNRYTYCLNNPLKYIDPTGKYEVGVDELQPGDIGLQRVPSNLPSRLARPAIIAHKQKPYAHGVMVLGVHQNAKGKVDNIVAASMRTRPQIEDLTKVINLNLETMGDYDFFRVTNDRGEALSAAYKAAVLGTASAKESKIRWDPKGLTGLLFGKDLTKVDNKMTCIEYLNYLYNNKFHDPEKGTTTPTHIYEYQEKIKRPEHLK